MAMVWVVLATFICAQLVSGSTINKALNRPTNMSSWYRPGSFLSSEAVDGDITARNPRIIRTADRQTFAWWTVDLQKTVQDPVVRIYFRVDRGNIWRRNGVQLYTSTTPFSSYPGTLDQLCYTVTGRADGSDIPDVLDAACRDAWRYLMVYTDTNNRPKADSGPILDFGEIEVLECRIGIYGSDCNSVCEDRKCSSPTSSCNYVTGRCERGCQPGWNGPDCTQTCSSGMYGANCVKSCSSRHCVVTSATCERFNGTCSPEGCQTGWRGVDCMEGSIINKALNRPTNMSSSYRNWAVGLPSWEAVDGDISARNPRIIHTAIGKAFAWWTVDLQETVQDPVVRIYFRVDGGNIWRRNGVQLYTSTTPFSSYPGTQDQLCFTVTGKAGGSDIPDVLDAVCPSTWQYLLVYTDTNNRPKADSGPMLDFGEIEVLVCSDPGTYGVNCDMSCSARQCNVQSPSCDRYTGACPGGCQTGWMGTDCTRECSYGEYGANCSKYCTSRYCVTSPSTCDHITGKCPGGCLSGYEGIDCTEECSAGTYGPGCNLVCGDRKCLSSTDSCDHVTGRCDSGCQPGWDGTDCTQKCTRDTYGPGCSLSCDNRKCSSISSCHHVTGLCDDGCEAGWNGIDCIQTCPRGTYGIGCIYTCGSCTGDNICDRITGNCPGDCRAGWSGSQCKQPCDREHYGSGCRGICATRHCSSGSSCSSDTGQCDGGCETGWAGTDCTAESSAAVNITAVVAGSVSAGIVVILIVVVIIIIWRRRRRTDMKDTHGPERIYYNVGNHRRSEDIDVDPEREYDTIDDLREAEVETMSAVAPPVENEAASGNTYEKFTTPSRDQESTYTELQ